jgi:L-rhamnose-H+ transport protein
MNGTFTLPMRFLGRWEWENVRFLFILVSCVFMPVAIALATISDLRASLSFVPGHAVTIALLTGVAWGFGTIMFGQGVSSLGIAMGNTLVLALSASVGSLLPIVVLEPGRLFRSQGKAIILGTVIAMAGIILCGYAGLLRERSQRDQAKTIRGDMVGHARTFGFSAPTNSARIKAGRDTFGQIVAAVRPHGPHGAAVGRKHFRLCVAQHLNREFCVSKPVVYLKT